jgi:hypothetical protein
MESERNSFLKYLDSERIGPSNEDTRRVREKLERLKNSLVTKPHNPELGTQTVIKGVLGKLSLRLNQYDSILPLSYEIEVGSCALKEDSRIRLDVGIELFRHGYSRSGTLITIGNYSRSFPNAPVTIAEVMKRYAIERGIPTKAIIKEENSLDTAGNAFFTKRDIMCPRRWKSLAVVTSRYHMARVRYIFGFIYGKDYLIDVVGTESVLNDDSNQIAHEKRNLKIFNDTFKGIIPGDDTAISQRMFSTHKLYPRYLPPRIS